MLGRLPRSSRCWLAEAFTGVYPKSLGVIAGLVALVGLIAAYRFFVEARAAGVELAVAE